MPDPREVSDHRLLDLLAEDFTDDDVTMGTMFRSPGLRVGGKIFAFLDHQGQLVVKLPEDRADELVERGAAEKVVMGSRTMREWVVLPAGDEPTATLSLWRPMAQDAYRYVDSLRQHR